MERAPRERLSQTTKPGTEIRTFSPESQELLSQALRRQVSLWRWIGPVGFLVLLGWLADSQAASRRGEDPVLLPEPSFAGRSARTEGLETFPEARFGQPPQIPQIGIRDSYAARAAAEMDEETRDELTHGGRHPASLPAGTREPIPQSVLKRQGVQEVALIAGDLGFFPKTVLVTRDVPVRLFVTGASKQSLCLLMDAFGVRKQIRANRIEEIQFTPGHAGKFRLYCPINGSEGTLIVKEAPLAPDLYSDARRAGGGAYAP